MAALTPEQRRVGRIILRRGRKRGAKRSEIIAAMMTGLVEANLMNPDYGDGTSVGWRQETASSYPNVNRRNVRQSADRFFEEIKSTRGSGMTPGQKAQAVQRSAFPERYDQRRGQALDVIDALGGSYKRNQPGRNGKPTTVTLQGTDNRALRGQILGDYLANKKAPGALVGLFANLAEAKDIPGSQLTVPGRPGSGRNRGGARGPMLSTGEPVGKLLTRAIKWDKAQAPYAWGGGHGSTAKPGTPVDCSGYWSGILNLKKPLTSGDFMSWGKPGPGRNVTIYTHQGHIIGRIKDPRTGKWRWFGTSKSNPASGAGEIEKPSAAYLASFVQRHPA